MTRAQTGPARRAVLSGLGAAALLALLWAGGFAWFLSAALTGRAPPPAADGIVALTGGAGRVETALRLLADGHARRLLTAEWARANAIRSLIVVTAGYHMPRAMAELTRALPGVALYPAPVSPPSLHGANTTAMLRLLAGEYTKWLVAAVGLTALEPVGPPRAPLERGG
jgi:uncharacterized SAM-binding protein YcdF (DUF218 family)